MPNRMAIIKKKKMFKNRNSKCWQRGGELGALAHCWWDRDVVQALWGGGWPVPSKQAEDYHAISSPALGIYAKE